MKIENEHTYTLSESDVQYAIAALLGMLGEPTPDDPNSIKLHFLKGHEIRVTYSTTKPDRAAVAGAA